MIIERIYLSGFMTSGKSTIGPILANVLGWNFYDLDRVIEANESKSIVEIFNDKGESYFRMIEFNTLAELSKQGKAIISLGGGTMCFQKNFDIIKNTGTVIYLKASPEALYKRLKNKIDRPFFRDLVMRECKDEEFIDRIMTTLKERSNFYEQSDIIINTDQSRIGITVDKIATIINNMLNEKNRN